MRSHFLLTLSLVVLLAGCGVVQTNPSPITYSGPWTTREDWDGYRISVDIFYPVTWYFGCCGDRDSESWHSVYPMSLEAVQQMPDPLPTDFPMISIVDQSLVMCPGDNMDFYACGIGAGEDVTPAEYSRRYLRAIDAQQYDGWGYQSLKKKGVTEMKNFKDPVPIYEGFDNVSRPIDVYFVTSSYGFFEVIVYNPGRFDPALIREFLDRLKPRPR